MNELLVYGVGSLMICFAVLTFILYRVPNDIFPEEYEFHLDPFWYIIGIMFLGCSVVYIVFPTFPDMIHPYRYLNLFLPFVFATLLYLVYIFGNELSINLVTFALALVVCYLQPDDFQLFPDKLAPWQDKLVIALFLFVLSRGLGLLNGLPAIASMQFSAVMISAALMAYFGALPQILGVIALTLLGCMLAFSFFSWPPERLIISHGGFSSLGFVMGCFMLTSSTEFADASMCIAASYLFTEVGISFYNHYLCRDQADYLYMSTSYYRTSQDEQYTLGVARGILKILVIDVVLSVMQIAAISRLSLIVFSIALNLWLLSILSGDTSPEDVMSLTKWSKKAIKGFFSKSPKEK